MQSVLSQFIAYLESKDLSFKDYQSLHHWSINEIGSFWESIATFFEISFYIDGKTAPCTQAVWRSAGEPCGSSMETVR